MSVVDAEGGPSLPKRVAGRSLTRKEFDAVIRRASELAASEAEVGDGGFSEAEIFRIAGEVGLPQRYVRRALAEVRTTQGSGILDRLFGSTRVSAWRIVPGTPTEIASVLDDFLVATQLLQRVRRTPAVLQYRPALDWVSQIARAASFTSRKYYVASARWVEARLEAAESERTLVELTVDPGTRGDNIGLAFLGGGGAGALSGVGAGLAVAMAAPVAVAVVAGVVVGAGVLSIVTYSVGASHRRKLREVQAELEGILDRMEVGESLEPPPPSWQRWVRRQFHGVARELRENLERRTP